MWDAYGRGMMTPPSAPTDDPAHVPAGDGGHQDVDRGPSEPIGDGRRTIPDGLSRSRKPRGIASYPPDRS